MQDYEIRDCRGADEYPEILRLLEANFVKGEPTLEMFLDQNKDRITQEERTVMMDDLMRRYEALLRNSFCRVIVHRGVVVGVSLMCVEDNPSLALTRKGYYDVVGQVQVKSRLLAEYFECVISRAEEDVNFFQTYPHVRRTLELVILSIDEKHRGHGFAAALIQDSIELGKVNKADIIYGQFTSPFSQRAAKKMGFRTYLNVDAMKLLNYQGNAFYNGTNPFVISEMFMFLSDVR